MVTAAPRTTEEKFALFTRAMARKIDEAKRDPCAFVEFVMREEHTRERIRVAPHQKVKLDFVLAHEQCVVREPPGFAKSYTLSSLLLWLLGHDVTHRAAFVSDNQKIAGRPLSMVREYIENAPTAFVELSFVFPALKRSFREQDSWGQYEFTVDRPPGIKDSSAIAIGAKGGIMGARLRTIIVDDILDIENTQTKEARDDLLRWFFLRLYSRRDPNGARVIVSNTPWNADDLTYTLEGPPHCWPTLAMGAEGDILISNTDWTSDELRPAKKQTTEIYSTAPEEARRIFRLKAHDAEAYGARGTVVEPSGKRFPYPQFTPDEGDRLEWCDEEEKVPLWPERYGEKELRPIRATPSYALTHKLNPRLAEAEAKCQRSWIEECKRLARAVGYHKMPERKESGATFATMGVDLAFTRNNSSDPSSIVCIEYVPKIEIDFKVYMWMIRILSVRRGKWDLDEIVENIHRDATRFGIDRIRVETNGGGNLVRDALIRANRSILVSPHYTGVQNKWHRWFGVESVFLLMKQAAILIPNDKQGSCEEPVRQLLEECLSFKRTEHTGDCLIGLWLAKEELREVFGASLDLDPTDPNDPRTMAIGANITAR